MKKNVSVAAVIISVCLVIISCSPNNVKTDDSLKKYFDAHHVTGTFGLYNNGTGEFLMYNLSRFRDSAYLPASTFKIVNSLIGIETGRIADEKMQIRWDGVVRRFPNGDTAVSWNKDLTMEEAFKASAVPYYQEVARRIGRDTMQRWLDSLKYGNHTIGARIDSFWLDNTLKLTPDEEMGLAKRLYFGQLPFQKRTQDIVKKVMLQENNANYQLSYKTGWGFRENGNALGWVVGWIEENKHPYFFVLNVEGPHSADMIPIRLGILRSVLKEQGFFEGKK
ncbi:class D beta-lactamase [Sediminibacterium soli]|uniref:class D beta-lactamase n=1 Tax=Sediminibacterium soli TaxID=2698829 RepID=UPI0013798583|nr:class D beta-lactamase [Sediminibacterium soli]NCI47637.1 class D beta-lactamase [Sediminibacterium soli]